MHTRSWGESVAVLLEMEQKMGATQVRTYRWSHPEGWVAGGLTSTTFRAAHCSVALVEASRRRR